VFEGFSIFVASKGYSNFCSFIFLLTIQFSRSFTKTIVGFSLGCTFPFDEVEYWISYVCECAKKHEKNRKLLSRSLVIGFLDLSKGKSLVNKKLLQKIE
jgi:hypothetical protein